MQFPLFPEKTKLINATLGVLINGDTVYYLHNGSPIFCHEQSDLNHYRYILGNLVEMNLCSCRELSDALGIPIRSVQRYAKVFREKGSDWYFRREQKHGGYQKLNEDAMDEVQALLNQGVPVAKIAREMGVTEGAIRYHIRNDKLKKK